MMSNDYLVVILVAVLLAYIFRKWILRLRKSLFFDDTIGIGLYTILGLQKRQRRLVNASIAFDGIVSAGFGG
jgi:uncharacterized membrane protein YeiH